MESEYYQILFFATQIKRNSQEKQISIVVSSEIESLSKKLVIEKGYVKS